MRPPGDEARPDDLPVADRQRRMPAARGGGPEGGRPGLGARARGWGRMPIASRKGSPALGPGGVQV